MSAYGPYKGAAKSYQTEDASFFFGRDKEARRLMSRVLSSRATLLYARSGAGKTSLLNARVIPGLEKQGWIVVRRTFGNDPLRSLQIGALRSVLVPPETEAYAINEAMEALDIDGGESIETLYEAYDDLDDREDTSRQLISSLSASCLGELGRSLSEEPITPWFHRLLRESVDVDEYLNHLTAYATFEPSLAFQVAHLSEQSPLSEVLAVLRDLETPYRRLLERALPSEDERDLSATFSRLFALYGSRCPGFRMVLILDQFEELYTRFLDPGPGAKHPTKLLSWKLRQELVESLERLYSLGDRVGGDGDLGPGSERNPIRLVVSLREDYLGSLDGLRRFIHDLDDNSYRLSLLTVDQARQAIQEPARIYGFGYTEDCYDAVVDELTIEELFVEPGLLQMVCARLWDVMKAKLSANGDNPSMPMVEKEVFEREVGGVDGIVDAFVGTALGNLSEDDKSEALDILQALVTPQRTRNIVDERALIQAPFRFKKKRRELAERLEQAGVVRRESRLGGRFFEINHEILIDAILEAYRTDAVSSAERLRFRRGALACLNRIAEVDSPREAAASISRPEFEATHEHRDEINIGWKNPRSNRRLGPEIMYRAALRHARDEKVLRHWARHLDAGDEVGEGMEVPDWSSENRILNTGQWRLAAAQFRGLEATGGQIETLYRSALCRCGESEEKIVEYWTERMMTP